MFVRCSNKSHLLVEKHEDSSLSQNGILTDSIDIVIAKTPPGIMALISGVVIFFDSIRGFSVADVVSVFMSPVVRDHCPKLVLLASVKILKVITVRKHRFRWIHVPLFYIVILIV